MKKKVFKAIAGSAAACFLAGVIIVSGGNRNAAAEDGYIANYTFEDGQVGDFMNNGLTLTIEEGKNSDAGAQFGENVSGNACLKVSDRSKGNDWWERNGVKFDLKKLTPGVRYEVSFDFTHDNGEVEEKGYSVQRAFKIGTYFSKGDDGSDPEVTDMYGQIGSLMGVEQGAWERITGTITVQEDAVNSDGEYYMYIFMGYPEAAGEGGNVSYKDKNTEDYYIDNFTVKEYVAPTEKPAATQEPAPTQEPPAAPAPTPYIDTTVGSGLEIGYEEAVGNLVYVVTGTDTVEVKEFDTPKSSLVIPSSVVIEDYTFKVTTVAANAFKGDSDIKKLTIGDNVTGIGKNAFFKCTSLKKITIKSSSIKSIGKKAFKKTSAKATVKVPKAKKAAYKKLLKKAGISAKAKIK